MKTTKTAGKGLAMMFLAIIIAGTVMAAAIIWTEQSSVNVILKGNVVASPSLATQVDIVQGSSTTYTVNVTNPGPATHTYTLTVTSDNAGITPSIEGNATREVANGNSTSYTVTISASSTATGTATLTWAMTQT